MDRRARRGATTQSLIAAIFAALAFVVGAGAFTAPGLPAAHAAAAPVRAVTTIYPYASVVQAIGGEHVTVTHLLPAGASPHTFEPRQMGPSRVRLRRSEEHTSELQSPENLVCRLLL